MVTNGSNGFGKKRQATAARLIAALKETQGLLTMAAKRAGIGYRTAVRYVEECPSVKRAALDAREHMVDLAESKLMSEILAGNMTAIIFYLKCQGKARGYVERQEVTGESGKPLKVEIIVQSEAAKKLTQEIVNGKGTE